MIQFFTRKGTFNYRAQNDNITHRTKEMTKLRLLLLSLKKSWVDKNTAQHDNCPTPPNSASTPKILFVHTTITP